MSLNKVKGHMYNFITHTWNPIKGKCPHACGYCYMDKIYKRFGKTPSPVHLDERELHTNLGNGNFIFVGSSNDLFAYDINPEWVKQILQRCNAFDNSYLFHTKNPDCFSVYSYRECFPRKSTFCITLETNRYIPEIMKNAPEPYWRSLYFSAFASRRKMVTIEPIMDFDIDSFVFMLKKIKPEQVNIGADTGNNYLPEPPKEKVLELIAELEKFTVVHRKKNLERIIK